MVMRFTQVWVVILVVCLAGCARGVSTTSYVPQGQQALQHVAPSKARSAGGTYKAADFTNSFESARGKNLTDAQIDSYIDSSVTGSDRALAHRLMRLMPSAWRGDFVYITDSGRIWSNNPSLPHHVTPDYSRNPFGTVTEARTAQTHIDATRHALTQPTTCGPGPSNTGPYIRYVSRCSFVGAIGFVNLTCGTTGGLIMGVDGGDKGFLYFEVAHGTGSLLEAGLQWNSDSPDPNTGAGGLQPYMRRTPGSNPAFTNGTYKYSCGQTIVMADGPVYNENLMYTFIANVSNYDPQSYWFGSKNIQFPNPTWEFYTPNSDMKGSGTDDAGALSPCMTCSIARVTSIGQTEEINDGSYFGVTDSGTSAIEWQQVGFGNWLNGCEQGASFCYLAYSTNYQVYFDSSAGIQTYSGNGGNNSSNVSISDGPNATGYGPWETQDSIALPLDAFSNSARKAASAFPAARPPTCTRDSKGYCVALVVGSFTWDQAAGCYAGGYGATTTAWVGTQWTYILTANGTGTLVPYSESRGVDDDCTAFDIWGPGEPKVVYNDPNLP